MFLDKCLLDDVKLEGIFPYDTEQNLSLDRKYLLHLFYFKSHSADLSAAHSRC